MPQANTLELAKEKNPEAIAKVINYILEPLETTARVALKDAVLELIIEASHTPNQRQTVEKVHNLIKLSKLEFIKKVIFYGKAMGTNSLAWYEELELGIDAHQPENLITPNPDTEQASTWEQGLEAVIDSVMGRDFNQVEIQKFIDKLRSENPLVTQEQICSQIINQKSLQSGLFGAVTGVGGLALLPVAIPANLYTSWKIQAATIRAIACVYGYPPSKADTCLVLFGAADSKMQALKNLGIEAAKVATKKAVDSYMTGQIMKSILKLSLREAATKMAQKALVTKMIPLVGAPIGFGFDWFATQAVGKVAIKYYSSK